MRYGVGGGFATSSTWLSWTVCCSPVRFWLGLATRAICVRFGSGQKAAALLHHRRSPTSGPAAPQARVRGRLPASRLPWLPQNPAFGSSKSRARYESSCSCRPSAAGGRSFEKRAGQRGSWREADAGSSGLLAGSSRPGHPFFPDRLPGDFMCTSNSSTGALLAAPVMKCSKSVL